MCVHTRTLRAQTFVTQSVKALHYHAKRGNEDKNLCRHRWRPDTIVLSYLLCSPTGVSVTSGKVVDASMTLTVAAASSKPGDCDNSGTVTIAEVQSAINMFLGSKTVESCVDIDNSNSVSIAEVQKVINSFLGL